MWAIVPAAGRGSRFESPELRDTPKQYAPLAGATVIEWSLRALLGEPRIAGVMVCLGAADAHWPQVAAALDDERVVTTVGGATRQDSVIAGLRALAGAAAAHDWALVHDAARPCLTAADLESLLDALQVEPGASSGALLAAPVVDTMKRERDGCIDVTVEREGLWRALTPQVFAYGALLAALEGAAQAAVAVTDEAQAMERVGIRAALVRGSAQNLKVTRGEDLRMAATILQDSEAGTMRIGQGFDVHTFGEGDHVTLGGVRIPYARGVVAHSDGDVVIHALCDAILGALGEGDIGQHFPDTDARYRGADSRVFLRVVTDLMHTAGLRLVNADVTVLAEAPRIAKFKTAMSENLGADLKVPARRINIKATTTERLGFVGRGEGLAASAAVLLA